MSVISAALAVVKRVAVAIGGWLPTRPPSDVPPPDIDGKREVELDPNALRRVELSRKEGKGGFR